MENEIVVKDSVTEVEIRAQVNLIQKVMLSVMKEDEHYGVIPGCGDKRTLLKAGAEKLLSTFRIAVDPIVSDLSGQDEARYRVTARGISQVSGMFLGAGIGECSSNEDKYKWRRAVSDNEFEATTEDRKRIKYTKDREEINQVRTNFADIANTVLKMAKKRAQIDMTLTVTAASDIFTQDIEDPEDLANVNGGEQPKTVKPKTETPQPTTAKEGCISIKQKNRLYAIWKGAGKTDEEMKTFLKEKYNIESTLDIKWNDYEDVCSWAEKK